MKNLIPHFVHQHLIQEICQGDFDAAALFVDISGFTHLTETLMQHEKDGAEVLTEALNRIFGPLVAEVYAHGGFITTFAGDAFTAVFPFGAPQQAALSGLQTAFAVQDFFAQHGLLDTKYGQFEIGVKAGLSMGGVSWGILGQVMRRAFFFRGSAVEASACSESLADKGDIVGDDRIWPHIKAVVQAVPIDEAHFRLTRLLLSSELARPIAPPHLAQEALTPFVMEEVVDWIGSGAQAEFRNVVNVFISFQAPASFEALNAFVSRVLELCGQYSGYFKTLDFGDKGAVIVIVFGAPVAHENDLERAANLLLSLLETDIGVPWRAGLTGGTVYAGIMGGDERCEYTVMGDVVNLAARLMQEAEWGQVLTTDRVASRRILRTLYIDDFHYKGFADPLPTYSLLGVRSFEETFFDQAMVGRQHELERLVAAAQPIFEGWFAGAICIYGEAGIGKSHLAYELRRALLGQGDVTWFTGQTDQILRQAFNPFSYFLKRYFEQFPEATVDENKASFETRLQNLVADLQELEEERVPGLIDELVRTRSVLGALVGLHWPDSLYESLDGNLRYQNTLFALKTLLLAESCFQPVVLEIEDFHWLDQASHETLTTLSRNVSNYPLLLVLTSRYADDGSKPTLTLAEDVPITTIDLNVLSPEDLRLLAKTILGGPVADDLLDLLLERTQANPFFAQQFLYYFRENDLLEQVEPPSAAAELGAVWVVKKDIPVDVPTNINAILIARIDRLSQSVKDVVKAAAVLGREFDDRVLAHMLQADVSEQVRIAEQEQVWSRVG